MAATDVTICSNALLLLGAQAITSLLGNDDRTTLMRNLYPSVRDSTLRSHPWNCAVKRVALAPDVAVPAFDWDNQFTLPADFMRVLSVGLEGEEVDFKIESGKLLCDDNPAYLRYIWRNEVPASWDPMLVRAMEIAMAAASAYAITQSAALRDSLRDELLRHMKQARAVDGQDDPPQTLGDSPLLSARAGARSWRA